MKVSCTRFVAAHGTAMPRIESQPQMLRRARNDDPASGRANAQAVARGAKPFGMPTVLTTTAAESFATPFIPDVARDVFPERPILARPAVNAHLDDGFVDAVDATRPKRLDIGGSCTGTRATFSVLEVIRRYYAAAFVADACGDTTPQVQERAAGRITQTYAISVRARHFVYQLEQDWSRTENHPGVVDLLRPLSAFGNVRVPYGKWTLGVRVGWPAAPTIQLPSGGGLRPSKSYDYGRNAR